MDEDPDLLAIGFSANDLVGSSYGPDSHEVMDITIRTDRLLERFFTFLMQQVGRDNLVIAITADHGVAPLPELAAHPAPQHQCQPHRSRCDCQCRGAGAANQIRHAARAGMGRPSQLGHESDLAVPGI